MKSLFIAFALLSFSAYGKETSNPLAGGEIFVSTYGATSFVTFASSSKEMLNSLKKEAKAVQNDSQEYFQAGTLSLLLEKKVELLTSQNPDLSEREAVGALLDMASAYLAPLTE